MDIPNTVFFFVHSGKVTLMKSRVKSRIALKKWLHHGLEKKKINVLELQLLLSWVEVALMLTLVVDEVVIIKNKKSVWVFDAIHEYRD